MNDYERSYGIPAKRYPVTYPRGKQKLPDYERVARLLTDADLEAEILARIGSAGYLAACVDEFERRAARDA